MNKTIATKYIAALILAMLLFSACSNMSYQTDFEKIHGTGNLVEETRAVSNVTGADLNTIGELTIKLGDTESLVIEAQSNLMDYIETEMLGETVRIRNSDGINLVPTKPIKYILTVKSLDTIKISATGGITAPDLQSEYFSIAMDGPGYLNMGELNADTVEVNVDSSGNLTIGELNADTLEVNIDSSGNVDISGGEVKTQNITINSGGSYIAPDLVSGEAEVLINSSGSVTIWVRETLTAVLTSTGDLNYRGNPTVDANTNLSLGKVNQISD
jgi:hypothetical protein